jgi:hypothetical protein
MHARALQDLMDGRHWTKFGGFFRYFLSSDPELTPLVPLCRRQLQAPTTPVNIGCLHVTLEEFNVERQSLASIIVTIFQGSSLGFIACTFKQ